MNRFPETRQTLICRIANDSESPEWAVFLDDYWGPVLRFAMRRGQLKVVDAEDIAAETFVILVQQDLLAKWLSHPRSKLRSLLFAVVSNLISNRARINSGRERKHDQIAGSLMDSLNAVAPQDKTQAEALDAEWYQEILRRVLEEEMRRCMTQGKLDDFRIFYGRIVEGMSNSEIAASLGLTVAGVESRYRRIRADFTVRLRAAIRQTVERYGRQETEEEDFETEWREFSRFLAVHGDLEQILRLLEQPDFLGEENQQAVKAAVLLRIRNEIQQDGREL